MSELFHRIRNTGLWHEERRFSRVEALVSLVMLADENSIVEKNVSAWAKEWNWSRKAVYRFIDYLQENNLIRPLPAHPKRTPKAHTQSAHPKSFIIISLPESYEEETDFSAHPKRTPKAHTQSAHLNGYQNTIPEPIQKRIDFELKSMSETDKNKWSGYQKYINDEGLHRIRLIKEPLMPEQFIKLINRFGSEMVAEKLKAIENAPDCHIKYTSLYLTLESWCTSAVRRMEKEHK